MVSAALSEYPLLMKNKNKNILGVTNVLGMFLAASLGALTLTGCIVQPAGEVVVGPPAAVYVAPEPVYVGPQVVVPLVIGGGGRYYRR
jgi:hypothetical protein